jgi:hypothetical protein
MPAPSKTPPPEIVAYVRRRYAADAPVAYIRAEADLSLGQIYLCLDGVYDDGSGQPLEPLPRRSVIKRRRPALKHVRATLASRLWWLAERHAREIEERLDREDLLPDEREADARVLVILVRALRDLKAADGDVVPPQPANPAPTSEDDDAVPDDIDEFRRRLAERISRLAAADAAAGAGESSA